MIYLLLLILVYFLSITDSKNINKIDITFFLLLALISGLRYGVGTDFFTYQRYFELINFGYEVPAEPGFIYLSDFISNIGFNSQVMFLSLSFLTMLFIYKGLIFYSRDEYIYKPVLYLILLIFVFIPSLNVVRQILAAAIIFYASRHIINKNFIKFSVWILVAMLFHYSSILFFGLYFIARMNFKKFTLLLVLLGTFLLTNLGITTIILEFILNNLPFLDLGGYIDNYIASDYNEREIDYGIVFYINLLLLIAFILLKDVVIQTSKSVVAFNFFYLYILSYILSMDVPMFTRLTYFFSIYMVLIIPKFVLFFEKDSQKIVEYIILTLYTLLFLYTILNGMSNPENSYFIPYESNFNLRY